MEHTEQTMQTSTPEPEQPEGVHESPPAHDECNDGYWHWEPGDGGIYIAVWPTRGGRKVPEAAIRQEFTRLAIKQVDWPRVATVLRDCTGEKKLVAPPQDGLRESPGRVFVQMSRDRQSAWVRVFGSTGGMAVDESAVSAALHQAGITTGLIADAISEAVAARDPHRPLLVAAGKPPVHGTDATVEFLFRIDSQLRPVELEDGRVDFYNLNIVENVESGQVLAIKQPATPGQPGYTVTGDELPARPGRDVKLTAGSNVELSPDGLSLRAAAAGHVGRIGTAKVIVYPVYEVKGDVNLSTGNITFVGTVIVGGNVTAGTTITADRDVRVNGHVDGATIKAGGHVAIRRGIQGKNQSTIVAAGDVTAMFVENGDITAQGSVHIGEAVMHSRVTAGRRLTVEGKKGLIVGGRIRARDEVVATVVGSPLGTATDIEVGVPPEVRVEFNTVTGELKRLRHELDQAKKNAKIYRSMVDTGRTLSASRQELYLRLLASQSGLKRKVSELESRLAELQDLIANADHGRIRVKQLVYPGVRLTIGYQSMHVRDQTPGGTFNLLEGDIKLLSL